jgi:hypothetical protein
LLTASFHLQLDETPLDGAADDEVTLDAVAAAARDIERIRTYVANLAGLANEVLEQAVPEVEDDDDDDDVEYGKRRSTFLADDSAACCLRSSESACCACRLLQAACRSAAPCSGKAHA